MQNYFVLNKKSDLLRYNHIAVTSTKQKRKYLNKTLASQKKFNCNRAANKASTYHLTFKSDLLLNPVTSLFCCGRNNNELHLHEHSSCSKLAHQEWGQFENDFLTFSPQALLGIVNQTFFLPFELHREVTSKLSQLYQKEPMRKYCRHKRKEIKLSRPHSVSP